MVWEHKNICLGCRSCCKFFKDEIYFAPVFTRDEFEKLKTRGISTELFKPYKKNLYQVQLIKAEEDEYVCPFLNEKSLCDIYSLRPADCSIWPLIVMKDRDSNPVLASFNKDFCQITDKMKQNDFDGFIKRLVGWFDENRFVDNVRKYPDLIWDYEPDTFIIKPIKTRNLLR